MEDRFSCDTTEMLKTDILHVSIDSSESMLPKDSQAVCSLENGQFDSVFSIPEYMKEPEIIVGIHSHVRCKSVKCLCLQQEYRTASENPGNL